MGSGGAAGGPLRDLLKQGQESVLPHADRLRCAARERPAGLPAGPYGLRRRGGLTLSSSLCGATCRSTTTRQAVLIAAGGFFFLVREGLSGGGVATRDSHTDAELALFSAPPGRGRPDWARISQASGPTPRQGR